MFGRLSGSGGAGSPCGAGLAIDRMLGSAGPSLTSLASVGDADARLLGSCGAADGPSDEDRARFGFSRKLSRSPRSMEVLPAATVGGEPLLGDLQPLLESLCRDEEMLRSLLRAKPTASRFDYKSRICELSELVDSLKAALSQQLGTARDLRAAVAPVQAKINTRLSVAVEEVASHRADAHRLNQELAAVRQKSSSHDARLDELHQALREARQDRRQVIAECAQRTESCQDACRRELGDLQEACRRQVAELVDQHQKRLDELARDHQQRFDELARSRASLASQLEEAASRERELAAQVNECGRNSGQRDEQLRDLQAQVAEKDGLLRQRSADLRRAEEALGRCEAELYSLRARLAEREDALTRKADELREATEKASGGASVLAAREAEVEALKARLEERAGALREKDGLLSQGEARERALQAQIDAGERMLRERAGDAQDLQAQLRDREKHIGELVGDLRALTSKLGDAEAQLAERSAGNDDLRSQVAKERELGVQRGLELQARGTQLADVTAQLNQQASQLSQRASELDMLRGQLRERDEKLQRAQAQLADREDFAKRVGDEQAALQARHLDRENALEARLREKDELLREKDRDLRESIHSIKQIHGDNNEQLQMERQHAQKLENELQVSRANEMGLHETLRAQEREMDALRSKLASHDDKLTEHRSALAAAESERDGLATSAARDREDLRQLQSQLEAARGELASAQLTLEERSRDGAALDHSHKALQAEFAAYVRQVEARRSELAAQRGTVETQREYTQVLEQRLASAERARRELHNTVQELRGSIRVFCRVRPAPAGTGHALELSETDKIGMAYGDECYNFAYDRVFSPASTQLEVFDEVSHLVQSALDGFKVCIFAYGQTGSGKTFTMQGTHEPSTWGLIPRSLSKIFETSSAMAAEGWKWSLQASFFEVYNETFRDLLQSGGNTCNGVPAATHAIKHDDAWGAIVTNMTVVNVEGMGQIRDLTARAAKQRSVGATDVNSVSSRSHAIFALYLKGTNEKQNTELHGALHLVDLAGSERLDKSGSTGDRLKETQSINRSLSSLADVFLAKAERRQHVPFRNSKLTHLMEPCLSGQGKTLMLVNVCEDEGNAHETLCSLRFASQVAQCSTGGRARRSVRPLAAAASAEATASTPRTRSSSSMHTHTITRMSSARRLTT
eukprot:TRINITY_DN3645_c0_g1_i1.p1 TRINITY_DN3645_c0_g1~~TRINITY_DN3645_c0_g1_i1.p1  ORF type:complete len:1161 (-),score=384.93 TRINITY_DN3645_c0_g1_i1:201-3683(-)